MNDTDFIEASLSTLPEIFLNYTWNVFRREGMQVDGFLNRNDNRLAKGRIYVWIAARRIL